MKSEYNNKLKWLSVVFIILAGFLLRMWVLFAYGSAYTPETFEYDEMARNLLAGKGYMYVNIGTPYYAFYSGVFYVWFNAFMYYFFSPYEYIAIFVVQAIISSLLAVVIFLIAQKIWNFKSGLLAALLTLTHPGILYYDTHKIHALNFDMFLMTLSIFLLLFANGLRYKFASFLTGIFTGIAIHQRSSMAFFFPLACIWLWIFDFGDSKKKIIHIGLFIIAVLMIMTPMLVRNYFIYDKLLYTTTFAEHFWRGNFPGSYGSPYITSDKTVFESAPKSFIANLRTTDELGQYNLFWEEAFKNINQNPKAFVLNIFRKMFYFWTYSPNAGNAYPASYFYIYVSYYTVMMFLTLVGVICVVVNKQNQISSIFLIFALFASISLMHCLMYFDMRHRWALEPLMLIFTSIGVIRIGRIFCKTKSRFILQKYL